MTEAHGLRTSGARIMLTGALGLVAALAATSLQAAPIQGAGSTFAAPAIQRWSRDYEALRADGGDFVSPDWRVDYEPVGSLSGVMRLAQPEVDFAATEAPLTAEELEARGWIQFPILMGGVVATANLEGVPSGELRLSGPVLAGIYLGEITRWSDPVLAGMNPGLSLPDAEIEVLHRADGSGSTQVFTSFLSETSPEWAGKAGSDLLIAWPVGRGEKGSGGLAARAAATPNSLAYVEYGQALRQGLPMAALLNQAGEFVAPSPESFRIGLDGVEWSAERGFLADTTNLAGAGAYPVAVATYAVLPKDRGAHRLRRVFDVFHIAFSQGADEAEALGFIPVPPRLAERIEAYWASVAPPAVR
ncbi:phosphate ABC transporter substrate-binding protein PstS [Neomegalonema perideroedes]|uniref:phosphate ABC transporter substrate-binding protein PstS n=1 Tax=Neomegalonema perideroedes TaxID=217219 RepID=UPI00039EE2AF|nr:phosphate ABC transporter substrate-binding protein PstS [Neomegalonema perideroedes]